MAATMERENYLQKDMFLSKKSRSDLVMKFMKMGLIVEVWNNWFMTHAVNDKQSSQEVQMDTLCKRTLFHGEKVDHGQGPRKEKKMRMRKKFSAMPVQ